MSNGLIENKILSKILEERRFYDLNKHNVNGAHFLTQKQTYEFIAEYVHEHKETPTIETVVAECKEFEYSNVEHENIVHLAKKIKGNRARVMAYETLQQVTDKFNGELKDGTAFVDWVLKEFQTIKDVNDSNSTLGTNYATNGDERWEWYQEAKDEGSNKFIPTPYPTLTKYLAGGLELNSYTLLQAYTNRGKSWLSSQFALTGWLAGFGVLYYSPELSKEQQLQRFDTLHMHVNNIGLRNGDLDEKQEKLYKTHLADFDGTNETPFIVKTMEDLPNGLDISVIEADLNLNPNVKMVVIDGLMLMSHKGRDNNRNNISNTSRALRRLFGKYAVAGLVVHQTPTSAEKENRGDDETGVRVPTPPELHQYSESIAMVQDASTVLNFDQVDGLGALLIAKCRQPNVGKTVDLHCNFNLGFITEGATNFDF